MADTEDGHDLAFKQYERTRGALVGLTEECRKVRQQLADMSKALEESQTFTMRLTPTIMEERREHEVEMKNMRQQHQAEKEEQERAMAKHQCSPEGNKSMPQDVKRRRLDTDHLGGSFAETEEPVTDLLPSSSSNDTQPVSDGARSFHIPTGRRRPVLHQQMFSVLGATSLWATVTTTSSVTSPRRIATDVLQEHAQTLSMHKRGASSRESEGP